MSYQPLPERLRPQNLDEFIGQKHLVGENAILRKMVESGNIQSIILWGPPGVGKTTLSKIIASKLDRAFYSLSAVSSGVKDVRAVIEKSKKIQLFQKPNPLLFIDEIHRFSKSQQDSLLGAVEQGLITLIGATTENPSFEVISPLLSRCQVYVLEHLNKEDLEVLLIRALTVDKVLKNRNIDVQQKQALFMHSGGDARKFLNILEIITNSNSDEKLVITNDLVSSVLQQNTAIYDKKGELHYDIVSALIKSIRGSDANASVYWLARMLEGGEDIKFIARRLIISAAEDIGLANPNALLLANNCFDAIKNIGMPEARIILSQTAIYLANSPKSNSAYLAIDEALDFIKTTGNLPIPLHLRNSPTKLMKQLGYGKGYKYPHSFANNFVEQQYLPDEITDKIFYKLQNNASENKTKR